MDRRHFLLTSLAGAFAAPLAAGAQQAGSVRIIGFLGSGNAREPSVEAFRRGLAADLVHLKVDVLVVAGPPAIRAARDATTTIPIVFAVCLAEPVAAGYVKSLARPGGNITGLVSQYEDIVAKQVQLLREAVPNLSRLALLRHTSSLAAPANASAAAATNAGLKIHILEVGDDAGYEQAFRAARDAGAQAVHVLPSPIFSANRRQLIALAARYRLPAAYELRHYVEDGGLL